MSDRKRQETHRSFCGEVSSSETLSVATCKSEHAEQLFCDCVL